MCVTSKMFKLAPNALLTAHRSIQKTSHKRSVWMMTSTSTKLVQENATQFSKLAIITGMATAAMCCIYSKDEVRQKPRQDPSTLKSQAAFRSTKDNQKSVRIIDESVQGATRGRFKSSLAEIKSPADERIPIKIDDFATLTPARAQSIIQMLHAGSILDRASLIELITRCIDVFLHEPTIVDLRKSGDKITVVGDLHGSLPCLERVLELAGNLGDDEVLVIAGDYVDRGEHSLEVLCTLLLLKLVYPNNIILLRGNHEDIEICSKYGFGSELQQKYGFLDFQSIWESLSDVFASLPICARTEKALICHGGLPSEDFQLSDLEQVSAGDRFKVKSVIKASNHDEKLLQGILWSDPSTQQGLGPSDRGIGILFGPDVAKSFLQRHHLRYIIRGHEHIDEGTQVLNCGEGQGVVTVFSTSNYHVPGGTDSASILKLEQDGTYIPVTFTYTDAKGVESPDGVENDKTLSAEPQKIVTKDKNVSDEKDLEENILL